MIIPYFSEIRFNGPTEVDFVEIAVQEGIDVSGWEITIYNTDGAVRGGPYALSTSTQTIAGKEVYLLDFGIVGFEGLNHNGAIYLDTGDPSTSLFSSFFDNIVTPTEGPAFDEGLASSTSLIPGIRPTGPVSMETNDEGATYQVQTVQNPGTILCFVAGTQVRTVAGNTLVEKLCVGDMVQTQKNGLQEIRWVSHRRFSKADLTSFPKIYPIKIAAGALGAKLPKHDLYVSPQHRMAVSSKVAERMFGSPEVLISAKHLTVFDGIEIAYDAEEVEYFHILFDRHEIIFAEGAPTESLFFGPESSKSMRPMVVGELCSLFPQLATAVSAMNSILPIPKGSLQKKLAARIRKNGKSILECIPASGFVDGVDAPTYRHRSVPL